MCVCVCVCVCVFEGILICKYNFDLIIVRLQFQFLLKEINTMSQKTASINFISLNAAPETFSLLESLCVSTLWPFFST